MDKNDAKISMDSHIVDNNYIAFVAQLDRAAAS